MKSFKKKSSELGQGTIEYILILLVVVIVSISLLYQFNSAFSNFAQNYFGEYLACLLETGEMPNLGAPQGTTCDNEFEEFDLANGRRRNIESRPPQQGPTTTFSPSSRPESSGEGDEEGGDSARAGGGSVGVSNRGSRRSRSGGSGPRRSVVLSAPGENSRTALGSKKTSSVSDIPGGGGRASRSFSNSRTGAKRLSRGFSYSGDNRVKTKKTVNKKAKDFSSDEGRKSRIIAAKAKKTYEEEEDEPFTFTVLIKYLLIAGILLAIVVFLGGQILQFSKRDEG